MSDDDMEFIETRPIQRAEILRLFRLQPDNLDRFERMSTFRGIEEQAMRELRRRIWASFAVNLGQRDEDG